MSMFPYLSATNHLINAVLKRFCQKLNHREAEGFQPLLYIDQIVFIRHPVKC